ncbi:MAG: 50S ribosomal protein L3 [Clostridia bacterium]|nr:50S ribosomal protein L3 [Clostridia bacterium]
MVKAILGKKLGMTQVFTEDGLVIPVTVVEAGPMTVVQKKTTEVDGYEAQVFAFDQKKKNVTKPQKGIFDKAKVEPFKVLREFDIDANLEVGSVVKADIFASGDKVDVMGMTKGHGFSGVIKRWNQHRLRMTHGTGPVHREVGSLGANSSPSRVFKNRNMPGQYGNERVTIQNLEIVKVDADRNLLLIKGNVPGAKGAVLTVKQSVKAK